MSNAVWLVGLLVGPVLALGWNAWKTRSRRPEEPVDGVRAYERFREAMAQPVVPPGGRAGGRAGGPAREPTDRAGSA